MNIIQNLVEQYNVIQRNGPYKLSSGNESPFYVAITKLTLDGIALASCSNQCIDYIKSNYPLVRAVGGMTTGADPIVSSIITIMGSRGEAWKGFLVRKETKNHGLGRKIEGFVPEGSKVVVVEDVTTTGDSAYKVCLAAQSMKCEVSAVLSLVDRNEGAKELFEKLKIPFHSFYSI